MYLHVFDSSVLLSWLMTGSTFFSTGAPSHADFETCIFTSTFKSASILLFVPSCSWCHATVPVPTITNNVYLITHMPSHIHMHSHALASSVLYKTQKTGMCSIKHFSIVLLVVRRSTEYLEIRHLNIVNYAMNTIFRLVYSPVLPWLSTFLHHVSNGSKIWKVKKRITSGSVGLCVLLFGKAEWRVDCSGGTLLPSSFSWVNPLALTQLLPCAGPLDAISICCNYRDPHPLLSQPHKHIHIHIQNALCTSVIHAA